MPGGHVYVFFLYFYPSLKKTNNQTNRPLQWLFLSLEKLFKGVFTMVHDFVELEINFERSESYLIHLFEYFQT